MTADSHNRTSTMSANTTEIGQEESLTAFRPHLTDGLGMLIENALNHHKRVDQLEQRRK